MLRLFLVLMLIAFTIVFTIVLPGAASALLVGGTSETWIACSISSLLTFGILTFIGHIQKD